jgi:hypothetical protein
MRFSGAAKLSTLEHALKRDSLNIHQLQHNSSDRYRNTSLHSTAFCNFIL